MTRCAAALLLAALAPSTAGCIAAVVPLAAGAALVKRHAEIEGRASKPSQAAATLAAASPRSDPKPVPTALTALPPPDHLAFPSNSAIPAFGKYALAQVEAKPASTGRPSAILATASELRVVRGQCRPTEVAVFVDLDPGRGTFDPLTPGRADLSLAAALSDLRARGVAVVWFSRLSTNFEGAARAALVQAGLDPAGRDEFVLMRDIGERKQSLRDEVAKRFCPIAMVGDERADFDELYLYLKSPDAAVALDAMLGHGWFLASPFLPPQPSVPGDTP